MCQTDIFVTPYTLNSYIFNRTEFLFRGYCFTKIVLLLFNMIMEWYFNGSPLAGQTQYQCNATQSGLYYQIGNNNGCPVYSDTITLTFNSAPL